MILRGGLKLELMVGWYSSATAFQLWTTAASCKWSHHTEELGVTMRFSSMIIHRSAMAAATLSRWKRWCRNFFGFSRWLEGWERRLILGKALHYRLKLREKRLPPHQVSNFVDRLVRFMVAITGGLFLVVPMVIMTIDQSQTKNLVTVSISLLTFALILSLAVRVSHVETLVATATYAALLVVFVGTSAGSKS